MKRIVIVAILVSLLLLITSCLPKSNATPKVTNTTVAVTNKSALEQKVDGLASSLQVQTEKVANLQSQISVLQMQSGDNWQAELNSLKTQLQTENSNAKSQIMTLIDEHTTKIQSLEELIAIEPQLDIVTIGELTKAFIKVEVHQPGDYIIILTLNGYNLRTNEVKVTGNVAKFSEYISGNYTLGFDGVRYNLQFIGDTLTLILVPGTTYKTGDIITIDTANISGSVYYATASVGAN